MIPIVDKGEETLNVLLNQYDALKNFATGFFRYWWNQKGSNTDQGFDTWMGTNECNTLLKKLLDELKPIPQSSLKEGIFNEIPDIEPLIKKFLPNQFDLSTFKKKEILFLELAFQQGAQVMFHHLKNTAESSLTPKSISGVFVKYSERKPFVNGEYLCRFLTHLPVGLHGAEYLQYDKEEGGFMVEHNDYAKLEWFDESITDPKSIRDSEFKEWFFENCVINTGTLAEPVERSIDPYTMYVKLTSYFSKRPKCCWYS